MRISNLIQLLGPAVLFLSALALAADVYLYCTNAPLAACMRASAVFGAVFVLVIVGMIGKCLTRTTSNNATSRLGQLLLGAGLITEEELNSALHDHKKLRLPIGAMLVQIGAISHRELRQALESQGEIRRGAATVELATTRLSR